MDLPTCPACGQSVLDDDAEDCPFCGSSMSGKPSTKAAPAAPKKPAAAAKAAPKKKPPQAASKPRPSSSGDDVDHSEAGVIETDRAAVKRALPLSPKKLKGRTLEIVCPMCETVGYGSSKAAGKDVKCANRDCMVPIFTAPGGEEPDDADTETVREKKEIPIWMVAVALVVLGGAGFGWYYMTYLVAKPVEISGPTQAELAEIARMMKDSKDDSKQDSTKAETTDNGKKADNPETSVLPKGPSVAELRAGALDRLVRAAQSTGNRSKSFCRRLAAESYAESGDLEAAREQLNRESELSGSLPYYHLPTLVSIAWTQLKSGDTDSAANTSDQAMQLSGRLPRVGRFGLDASVQLAPLLVAVREQKKASELIGNHEQTDQIAQLSTQLALAYAHDSFDLNAISWMTPSAGWKAPQSTAVAHLLVRQGFVNEAIQWSQDASGRAAQSEAIAAVGQSLGLRGEVASGEVQTSIGKLSAIDRVRFFAALAAGQAQAQSVQIAAATLAKAVAAAGDVPKSESANSAEREIAAMTLGEVAQSAAHLEQRELAKTMLQRSLEYSTTSKLTGSLLQHAIRGGLLDEVAAELSTPSAPSTRDQASELLSGSLPAILAMKYRQLGRETEAKNWEAKAGSSVPAKEVLEFAAETASDQAALQKAANDILGSKAERPDERDWQHLWFLRLASLMQKRVGHAEGFEFAASSKSPVIREDAYQLLAAKAASMGDAKAAVRFEKERRPSPTERAALNWGIVFGLSEVKEEVAEIEAPSGSEATE